MSAERIEEAREKLRRAVEDGERLYRKGMHDPDGLSAKEGFRLSGILSIDLPDAIGAYDRLAAALREAQAENERLQRKIDAEIPWTKDGAYEALQAENERLRELVDMWERWKAGVLSHPLVSPPADEISTTHTKGNAK